MKRSQSILRLTGLLMVAALLITACGGAATATQAPQPTSVPPTTAPTAVPFEPLSLAAPNCDYGGEFASIEAVDEFTVKMTLCFPDPAFPSKVAFSAYAINDTGYLEETGGSGALVDNPNGTGPYKFVDWVRGDHITMVRNEDYWGGATGPENLIFRWSAECAQRLLELQAGTVDGIDNPCPDDFETISGDAALQLQTRGGTNVFYVGMNNTYPPFDNERVRQAFAMALDKQRIVDNFYPPGSIVATQFMPPSIFGFTEEVAWWDYDPAMAQQILEEEGVLPGFSTTLKYRNVVRGYLPDPTVVAQDIQAQLAEIGVELELVEIESGAYIDAADAGELEGLHMLGWGADYPDATNFLDYHFGPGASAQFGDGFQDIWDALRDGATRANADDRRPFYVTANELLKQHVPMIPIAHGGSGAAYKADIAGAYASDIGAEQFREMTPGDRDTFVWMQNGEPPGLYCADESDGEALRACEQMLESLLAYAPRTGAVVASLAESWEANADLTEWTFHIRQGVTFHNGATLDANDVVLSYILQWDASHPLHTGRDGSFAYFPGLFGPFLNAPAE
jgi:ABC-type transport system substrate-binding protein